MVTTVKEIQDRKAKLRETKAGRGELAEQEAVDKLARDRGEGADPITQELLDELRGKGIDVFDPKVLRKLNDLAKRGEITREEIQRLTARDEEINETLQEEQAAESHCLSRHSRVWLARPTVPTVLPGSKGRHTEPCHQRRTPVSDASGFWWR